jgi:4-amino-4-deoxychorismate lyase
MLGCLVNGSPAGDISVGERALQYGDGLFETIAVRRGQAEFVDRHFQRLQAGCERLALDFDGWRCLQAEIDMLSGHHPDAIIKIILSRASGGRGYRCMPGQSVTRIVSAHALPDWPNDYADTGVRVRVCNIRLAIQPRLAGIKHLNRLEQVLARAEWQDEFQEGLLLDYNGRLVEASMSNIFLVREGCMVTPKLQDCGVAGVMRSVVIDLAKQLGVPCSLDTMSADVLDEKNELFICNSLIGIWPVVEIAERCQLEIGSTTRELQQALNACNKTQPGEWQPS